MVTCMNKTVLIVGAGPTGLTAALTLAQQGIAVRIIDKRPEPIRTSNALAVQPRTLELWKALGIIDDATAKGHRLRGAKISSAQHALGELSFEGLPSDYPFILALPQSCTETILSRHLEQHGITVQRSAELRSLSQNEDCVTIGINGDEQSFPWVIGCDGVGSSVREAIGVNFRGYDLPQHFIMADLQLDWDLPYDQLNAFLSKQGPLAFIPLNHTGFGRLICEVSADPWLREESSPSLQDFRRLFLERCPVDGELRDPEWISAFWIHSRLAERYREKRVFLVGDAAHQHSPVGGQGMNTGMQDAYFLCQRLARVILEEAPTQTLDEYETVRRPIGQEVVDATTRMTKVLSTHNSFLQSLRNWGIWAALKFPAVRQRIALRIAELHHPSCID